MTPEQNAQWDAALDKLREIAPDAVLDWGGLSLTHTAPVFS